MNNLSTTGLGSCGHLITCFIRKSTSAATSIGLACLRAGAGMAFVLAFTGEWLSHCIEVGRSTKAPDCLLKA